MFLIMGFVLGSSVLFPPGSGANQDAWLAILLGLAEGLLMAMIYITLANRFSGKTLIEINDIVWGNFFGKLISVAFLWYVFHLGSLVITNFMDFIKFEILPATPASVIVLFGVWVCAMAASAGIEVLARCTHILFIMTTALFLFIIVLLIPEFNLSNFKPVMEIPLIKLISAGHGAATFPFGETVVFLMVIPFLNRPDKSRTAVVGALVISGSLLLLGTIRIIGVLGATAKHYLYPSFSAAVLVNIGEVLTRIEILTGINFLISGFIKISILIYITILGSAQLLKLKSYRTLTIPVWILISLLGVGNFASVSENFEFARKVYPFYSLPFEVGIPLVTLMVALIRKLPREDA